MPPLEHCHQPSKVLEKAFELFDHFPVTALCAEQSKRAKSNLEVQQWAFFSGYLLAKEENFGLGTSSKHKNVTEICEEVNKSQGLIQVLSHDLGPASCANPL